MAALRERIGCAGVVVLDVERRMVVLVKKRGRSDPWAYGFPKGRLDRGEEPAAGAMRELEEETGIRACDVAVVDGVQIDEQLRTTCRYLVARASAAALAPTSGGDVDEDLEWARWLSYDDAAAVLPAQRRRVLESSVLAAG